VTSDENFHISVLIGADYYWEFIQDHIVRGDGPTAIQSQLGYLFSGPLPVCQLIEATSFHVSALSCIMEDAEPHTLWQVESVGTTLRMQNTTSYRNTWPTRFQCDLMELTVLSSHGRLPMHPPLPSNYGVCTRRTRSMAYRLARKPNLLKIYDGIIREQEARGFIEKMLDHSDQSSVSYIPHHPVRKDSSTTPVRIVFDCSCRQSVDSPMQSK